MESNYHEESSEEVVDQDLGVGRSYECVFCKRGFNTAQALGGHMNIHRKDRARNKPKQHEINIPKLSSPHQPHLHYAIYVPTSSVSSNSTSYERDHHHREHTQTSNNRVGDWRMRLGDVESDRSRGIINQDKELDLELRLGYD